MKALLILPALLILGAASPGSKSAASSEARTCADRLDPPPPHDGGQPIAVLITTDPWAMLVGGDAPRLALYGDGLVIYRRGEDYRSVRLGPREADALRSGLGIETLACFIGGYGDTSITDQPEDNLFIGRGGRLSLISVYGQIRGERQESVPPQLIPAHDRLLAFDHPDSRPWLPERIEVVVWPYDYAPDRSIRWPAGWPDLNSETTRRRGESYSIFVPSSLYPRLVALLRQRPERGAIEINGRKWTASLRFPFPREAAWMSVRRD